MSTNNSDDFTDTLRECFNVYYYHTNFALTISTQEQGKLHVGILLEVRSAMTHISRANCASEISMDKRIEEIKSAQGHFIRAALDGYKIAYTKHMKKIDRRTKMIELCAQIPANFQEEHDALKSKRKNLTLEEDSKPTSLKALDNYNALYNDTTKYYKKLITLYNGKSLIKFGFKNIFMNPQWWIFTFIGWVLGKYF